MPSFLQRGPSYSNDSSWEVLLEVAKEWAGIGGVFKDVMGAGGCAFVWPGYSLAHVSNCETPSFSVFDPHKQCGAYGLGVCLVFLAFCSGCEGNRGKGETGRHSRQVGVACGWRKQQVVSSQAGMLQQGPSLGSTHVTLRLT